jgi:hypothetical protein
VGPGSSEKPLYDLIKTQANKVEKISKGETTNWRKRQSESTPNIP